MKALILVLALLPTVASAQSVLVAKNTPAGVIELSDEYAYQNYCGADHPMSATITDQDELVTPVCYTLVKNNVEIEWDDGVKVQYPLSLFKLDNNSSYVTMN